MKHKKQRETKRDVFLTLCDGNCNSKETWVREGTIFANELLIGMLSASWRNNVKQDGNLSSQRICSSNWYRDANREKHIENIQLWQLNESGWMQTLISVVKYFAIWSILWSISTPVLSVTRHCLFTFHIYLCCVYFRIPMCFFSEVAITFGWQIRRPEFKL